MRCLHGSPWWELLPPSNRRLQRRRNRSYFWLADNLASTLSDSGAIIFFACFLRTNKARLPKGGRREYLPTGREASPLSRGKQESEERKECSNSFSSRPTGSFARFGVPRSIT